MPQMAPVMWLPIFITMLWLLFWSKSMVYFNQTHLYASADARKSVSPVKTWLW
nr:TPA_asm: ATP8 [Gammarus chevreuxi]